MDRSRLLGSKCWAYLAPFAASFLCTVLLFQVFDDSTIKKFLLITSGDWVSIFGQVLFPASVAVFIVFVNLASGNFGEYLAKQNRENFYHHSFLLPILVFSLTTLLFILSKGLDGKVRDEFWLDKWLVLFLLLSFLSTALMITNLLSVVKLHRRFQLMWTSVIGDVDSESLKAKQSTVKTKKR